MLSYRHSFHAGNFADVIKHIVLVEILQYLCLKDKAFEYIDTHAGAGLFNLESGHATKLNEWINGIGKLKAQDWPEISAYLNIIKACNPGPGLSTYPGSPLIASHFLRAQDRAWLYELHPGDYDLLVSHTADNRQIIARQEDGFKGLLSLLPMACRRGLVLIDPPYEVKTDYETVYKTVLSAYKKFSTGIYAIWYPVVDRDRTDRMEKRFIASGISDIQRFELGLSPDLNARGMNASGMIVINPPWTLLGQMQQVLPRLAVTLGDEEGAFFKCDVLMGE